MDLPIAFLGVVGGIVAIVVIEVVFDVTWALTQRGWTHKESGRWRNALADFSRAIHLSPWNKWAIAGKAQLHRLME
ncbi:tetratricopeptide repeat protein [Phormidium tenue FACHB-886]|nr:tetratricopeptide repeat protein [Phormidium tenue FACHB-886]